MGTFGSHFRQGRRLSTMVTEDARYKLLLKSRGEDHFRRTTPPYDARFPNTNTTKICWQNYVDYHRCLKQKGEDHEPCNFFKRSYIAYCVGTEIEKNDTLLEKKSYPTRRF